MKTKFYILHKNKGKIIILFSLIIIMVNLFKMPKREISYSANIENQIAKGIVILEQDELIEKKADRNLFPIEYNFCIKNFDDKDNISEVDFEYKIKIESSVPNFPIKYKLIECNNNSEIPLNFGQTPTFILEKYNKETRKFKLYVEWNDVENDYSEDIEIKVKIEAVQSKEEELENEKI